MFQAVLCHNWDLGHSWAERLTLNLHDTRVNRSINVHFPIWAWLHLGVGGGVEKRPLKGTKGGLAPAAAARGPGAAPHSSAQSRHHPPNRRPPHTLRQPHRLSWCLRNTHRPTLIRQSLASSGHHIPRYGQFRIKSRARRAGPCKRHCHQLCSE